jgi:preprotein translocase subunit YajC
MLISPAYAQASGGGGGFDMVSLLPLVLIFVVFYFLLIRPQQKKAKVHRQMIGGVSRGDSIVTGGGIIGKVTKVLDDNRIQVEISDGVKVQIARATIADVISRGYGSNDEGGKKNKNKSNSDSDDS